MLTRSTSLWGTPSNKKQGGHVHPIPTHGDFPNDRPPLNSRSHRPLSGWYYCWQFPVQVRFLTEPFFPSLLLLSNEKELFHSVAIYLDLWPWPWPSNLAYKLTGSSWNVLLNIYVKSRFIRKLSCKQTHRRSGPTTILDHKMQSTIRRWSISGVLFHSYAASPQLLTTEVWCAWSCQRLPFQLQNPLSGTKLYRLVTRRDRKSKPRPLIANRTPKRQCHIA